MTDIVTYKPHSVLQEDLQIHYLSKSKLNLYLNLEEKNGPII